MQFGFYPGHENGCGHPRDCPHLGGASVGHLVHIVNSSENSRLLVHRQLDAERERNSKLVADVLRLEEEPIRGQEEPIRGHSGFPLKYNAHFSLTFMGVPSLCLLTARQTAKR